MNITIDVDLKGLSYNVCSMVSPFFSHLDYFYGITIFFSLGLFTLVLRTSGVLLKIACCYGVTSKIGL